ncbi:uncharacterized protein [Linepithema humile]|uniref:uncharacterized protein n=1 Tax=Linepithema humile TaxID=83485 RepID=UPI00351E0CC9
MRASRVSVEGSLRRGGGGGGLGGIGRQESNDALLQSRGLQLVLVDEICDLQICCGKSGVVRSSLRFFEVSIICCRSSLASRKWTRFYFCLREESDESA